MTTEALQNLKKEIIALFENHDNYEGFAKLQQHAFFTGYQAMKNEFLHNAPKGTDYKLLQQRLYLHIDDCISKEIARLQANQRAEQAEADRIAQAKKWFEKGLKATDLEAKISAYSEAIALNPSDAIACNNRGVAKCDLQQYQESIADYNQAIALKPDYAEAYHNRGIAKYNLQQYQEAITDYNKTIALKPDYANAYYNRGNAKYALQQYQEAIADYNKAITFKPDYASVFWSRALAYALLKNKQGILDSLREAIRLNASYKDKAKNVSSLAWLRGDSDFEALVR